MSSVRFAFLPLLSLLVLTVVSEQTAVAHDRFCDRCSLSICTQAVLVPAVVVEHARTIHTAHVVAVHPMESEATLVLNCPAAARVTIDGRVTHASGAMRQYQLHFHGDDHKFRIEIRLRDNDEKATYEFDHPLQCRRDRTIALSVTREQMQKKPDALPAKPETGSATNIQNQPETHEQARQAKLPSPLKQAIEHQARLLSKMRTEQKTIDDEVGTKSTRRDAAMRIRKQTEDAHQVKIVEVGAAVNDSAAIFAGKRLEAKKLELELNRAREVEQAAKEELVAAQHQQGQVRAQVLQAETTLEGLKRRSTTEQLTQSIDLEQSEMQRLADAIGVQKLRLNAADQLLKLAEKSKRPEVEVSLMRDLVTTAKSELADAQDQWRQAEKRTQQKQETLKKNQAGAIHVELE